MNNSLIKEPGAIPSDDISPSAESVLSSLGIELFAIKSKRHPDLLTDTGNRQPPISVLEKIPDAGTTFNGWDS